jgi:hypothetical protein
MRWHFSRGPRGTVVRGDLARLRRRRLAADPARLEQNRLDPLVPVFVLGVVRGARRVAAPDERAGAVLPPAAPDLARRDPALRALAAALARDVRVPFQGRGRDPARPGLDVGPRLRALERRRSSFESALRRTVPIYTKTICFSKWSHRPTQGGTPFFFNRRVSRFLVCFSVGESILWYSV